VTRSGGLAIRGDSLALERASEIVSGVTPFLLGALVPGIVAADQGGYWPTSWGWSTIALAWIGGVALILRSGRISGLELTFIGGLTALTAWTGLSVLWTSSVTQSVLSVERLLVYVLGAATAVAVVRAASYQSLLCGVWVGSTAVVAYGLLTRLLPGRLGSPDAIGGYRLAEPIGYWNGLGLLAALAAVLGFGLAMFGSPTALRAAAAASLPLLLPTLYLTFSRGAWLALGVALLAVVALSDQRLTVLAGLIVLAPPVAAAVWLANGSAALHVLTATFAAQTRAGHTLLWQLPLLALGAAFLAVAFTFVGRSVAIPRPVRMVFGSTLAVAAVSAVAVVLIRSGGPVAAFHRAHHSIERVTPGGTDLNDRLLSLSSNGRLPQWRVALNERRGHPVLGSGAGTYAQYWAAAGPRQSQILNVHNLYLETLAELGPLGLALLVVALGAPLAAAVVARRRVLVPIAAGVWVGFLVHVAYDWDWQLTGITLAAILCAGAILASARASQVRRGTRARRWGLAIVVALAGILGFYGLLGNRALARSSDALASSEFAKAASLAHDAQTWAPWSSEPWQQLAVVRTAQGDFGGARSAYRHAIVKDPHDWRLWLGLASVAKGAERASALLELRQLNPGVATASETTP